MEFSNAHIFEAEESPVLQLQKLEELLAQVRIKCGGLLFESEEWGELTLHITNSNDEIVPITEVKEAEDVADRFLTHLPRGSAFQAMVTAAKGNEPAIILAEENRMRMEKNWVLGSALIPNPTADIPLNRLFFRKAKQHSAGSKFFSSRKMTVPDQDGSAFCMAVVEAQEISIPTLKDALIKPKDAIGAFFVNIRDPEISTQTPSSSPSHQPS